MSIVGTRPPLISETNLYEPRHKTYMFQHLGGKQIILKFVMRIQRRINGIFINWMVKVSDMSWLHS